MDKKDSNKMKTIFRSTLKKMKFKSFLHKHAHDTNTNNADHESPPNMSTKPSLKHSTRHSLNHSLNKFSKKITKKPELKFAKSAGDTTANKKKVRQSKPCALTTMPDTHPALKWKELNSVNECDTAAMANEAASQCMGPNVCGPCKRIEFILNMRVTQTDDKYDKLSNIISSELEGYSHIGLSKDFRHLQIYHKKDSSKDKAGHSNVDYSDTKSLLTYIMDSLGKYDLQIGQSREPIQAEERQSTDVLTAVSKYMMELQSKKDFNNKYMKLGMISKGANGKIFAVKSWKSHAFYAMKEICFANLNISILYEILRNWRMVQSLQLLGSDLEIFVDSQKSLFLIVQHLYKGSMCELLKETYLSQRRCLSEAELKHTLQNGIMTTLEILHGNGYIHGDIKPENLVYEYDDDTKEIVTAVIDYDLCTQYETDKSDGSVRSEWRGTLGYSAPEWSPYKRVKSVITPKVDIYSLGLTMLILLCGEQPFLCPTAVRRKLEKEDPSINIKQFVYETMLNNGEFMIGHFLKELAPKITADLLHLLTRMLKHSVESRADVHFVISHQWFKY